MHRAPLVVEQAAVGGIESGGGVSGEGSGGVPEVDGAPGSPACRSGCDRSECSTPGTCSFATACALVGCNTAAVDDDGCFRPPCLSDADCSDDSRCTAVQWSARLDCAEAEGTCGCTTGKSVLEGTRCSPVAIAGIRGEWQDVVVTEKVASASSQWTFHPDASVDVSKNDGTGAPTLVVKQLSSLDQDQMEIFAAGPNLRVLLASSMCVQGADDAVSVVLHLDAATLGGNVSGCVDGPGQRPPLPALLTLARRY